MKDFYKQIYRISEKAAILQSRNSYKAEIYLNKMDMIIKNLADKKNNFELSCNEKKFNLPVELDEVPYFRPLFKMSTHKLIREAEADDTNAVDFDVPDGTNVYSVSDGIVTALKNDSITGGNDISFAGMDNYLYIFNKDENLIFCYRHLERFENIFLHSKIQKGQLIGKVGMTGFVITPHLHFAIYKFQREKKIKLKSLKIRFV